MTESRMIDKGQSGTAKPKHPGGRPKCSVSPELVLLDRRQGLSLRQIAELRGIGKSTAAELSKKALLAEGVRELLEAGRKLPAAGSQG
jgi:hypothetical protein